MTGLDRLLEVVDLKVELRVGMQVNSIVFWYSEGGNRDLYEVPREENAGVQVEYEG